jgi:hemolysin activation/secretion protein
MFKNKLLPFALLAVSPMAFAVEPPSSGNQMQQIPASPVEQKLIPNIDVKPTAAQSTIETDSAKMVVNRLRVTGAKAYTEADLIAQTDFRSGSLLTLSELRRMATKITAFYRRNGYFVAQAYLPAQDIVDGVVTITVVDGQYGRVAINNQSRVSSSVAYSLLDGINSGDPVTSAPLENRLLLLSDLPGVKVQSTLQPGEVAGTSDLIVGLTPGRSIDGSIDADNAGNRYTGIYRIGATVNFNEPLGLGDVATVRAMTSGNGLNYLRGSYQLQLGKARVGFAYSGLRYELGEEFESLGAHGTAQVASLFGSYPLIRSRNSNLYAGLSFDAKTFQDKVDTVASVTDKKANVLTASLSGDFRDRWGSGAFTSYAMSLGIGEIDLQTPAMRALDAATAQSNGNFNKLEYRVSRLQGLTDALSISAALRGQFASKNLDVSEKMELGGMYAVRAYPEGEAFADEGYVLSLEARLQLNRSSGTLPGQVQLIGFLDTGSVTVNKNPWGPSSNQRTLSGAGVGINWSETNNFMVRAYYAFKVGDEAATSGPDASGRFWIQAVKYF